MEMPIRMSGRQNPIKGDRKGMSRGTKHKRGDWETWKWAVSGIKSELAKEGVLVAGLFAGDDKCNWEAVAAPYSAWSEDGSEALATVRRLRKDGMVPMAFVGFCDSSVFNHDSLSDSTFFVAELGGITVCAMWMMEMRRPDIPVEYRQWYEDWKRHSEKVWGKWAMETLRTVVGMVNTQARQPSDPTTKNGEWVN
jgi:hypothetical protein